jgi:glutamine cyclotransferase
MPRRFLPIILCAILNACSTERTPTEEPGAGTVPKTPPPPAAAVQTYSVVKTFPHDPTAFTQGLIVHQGQFIESTGQLGQSTIRKVAIATGTVRSRTALENQYFGEGCTVLGGKAYMLTWLNQTAFIFDAATLRKTGEVRYAGEGWGLTNDGTHLIMSNGSNVLTYLDPASFRVIRSVPVTFNGSPLANLNELEWIEGEIWANVWQTDNIVRIDPGTGHVKAIIDLTGLLPADRRTEDTDVLNGIAYDAASKAVYVTGKNWPSVFQISVR